jgi:glycine/D-amino acid oxidase-like deaminating enzyme
MAKTHVAVVGAGAFGGWTALCLLRRGARVTLIESWGPGNSRASSGGETRVIRGTYGPNQPYTKMAARALELWQEHEQRWKRKFLHRIGVLWMAAGDDSFERGSLAELRAAGVQYEELAPADLEKRWPQIHFAGVRWGIYEPQGGYLTARIACQAVVDGLIREGGEFRQAAAIEGVDRPDWKGLALSDGTTMVADHYVFACGPWLGKLFPRVIGDKIRPTKQDVFFFGTPSGDDRFEEGTMPVWADHREHFWYGIPGNQGRGFKIADDARGPEFDPTSGERIVSSETLKRVREYMAFRFPGMKDAPLVETRVCQYENSPDEGFIIDRHPESEQVWLVGGGSGHGFKHGPALGEMVSGLVMGQGDPPAAFRLGRFLEPESR